MLNSRSAFALLSAVLLLALPACDSGGSEDDGISLDGQWASGATAFDNGSSREFVKMQLDLDQNGSNVSGTAAVTSNEMGEDPQEQEGAISGTYSSPDLDLSLDGSSGSLSCTVASESQMECEIELGEEQNPTLQLRKGASSDAPASVEGSWQGEIEGEEFALNLTQSGSDLTGNIEEDGIAELSVEGAYYSPILGVEGESVSSVELDCVVEDESSMRCDLFGAEGEFMEGVTLTREQ